MKNLTFLAIILLISSCAFHNGTIISSVTDKPVVHKDIAVGVASTNIVFNIGGLSKDALISEARKNMVRARPLEGAEQYNNITINVKNTYYIIGHKTKVTINADIIEPKDSVNQATYTENYLNKMNNNGQLNTVQQALIFTVGDSVIYNNYNYQTAKIVRLHSTESLYRVVISYTDDEGKAQTKEVSEKKIFVIMPEHFGLKLGQRFDDGVIVGFGIKHVMIKTMYGNTTVPYSY